MKHDFDDDKPNKTSSTTTDKRVDGDGDQPWQKKFMDDRDDNGNLSRVASRHRDKNMTSFAVILAVILGLLMVSPMAYWAIKSHNSNESVNANKITMASSEKASKAAASSSEAAAAASSRAAKKKAEERAQSRSEEKKKETSSSTSQSSSQEPAQSSSAPAASSSQQAAASSSAPQQQQSSAQQQSSSTQVAAGGSYTVKAGDNPYRIAVNHGMTLQELYALNPTAQNGIIPGMVLKVK
ncbi:MAG: LysM domain-containing protein [Schleiferilactobacillus perolens]|uniref:LysM peptidoglycan-binding domain-containing protein n=1 Tax=Schleiferilactobacillus perolens TaxID=100468 RepID=UPI0039EBB955